MNHQRDRAQRIVNHPRFVQFMEDAEDSMVCMWPHERQECLLLTQEFLYERAEACIELGSSLDAAVAEAVAKAVERADTPQAIGTAFSRPLSAFHPVPHSENEPAIWACGSCLAVTIAFFGFLLPSAYRETILPLLSAYCVLFSPIMTGWVFGQSELWFGRAKSDFYLLPFSFTLFCIFASGGLTLNFVQALFLSEVSRNWVFKYGMNLMFVDTPCFLGLPCYFFYGVFCSLSLFGLAAYAGNYLMTKRPLRLVA